eukprot:m.46919 g.46919  ORF g.46919 m.46919 type:complete len:121 (-) comp20372_c0_seq1:210-572(-)
MVRAARLCVCGVSSLRVVDCIFGLCLVYLLVCMYMCMGFHYRDLCMQCTYVCKYSGGRVNFVCGEYVVKVARLFVTFVVLHRFTLLNLCLRLLNSATVVLFLFTSKTTSFSFDLVIGLKR